MLNVLVTRASASEPHGPVGPNWLRDHWTWRKIEDLTIISGCDLCVAPDRRSTYDSIKPNVSVCLWMSDPDWNCVHCSGLHVPDEGGGEHRKRDCGPILANAHLVPGEFVEMSCWVGTLEDVAKRIAKMGVSDFSFLHHYRAGA